MKNTITMKYSIHVIGMMAFYLFIGCCSWALGGEQGANLLQNPGFEDGVDVNTSKVYADFMAAGVQVPSGEAVAMPSGVLLNWAHGWQEKPATGKQFEYVRGKAGGEVHAGNWAIRVVSPTPVGIIVGSSAQLAKTASGSNEQVRIAVVDGAGLDDNVIVLNKTYKFSVFAKGQGSVRFLCYPYTKADFIPPNVPTHEVQPPAMTVASDGWERYDCTFKLTNPDITYLSAVIEIKGDVSLDDISLQAQ